MGDDRSERLETRVTSLLVALVSMLVVFPAHAERTPSPAVALRAEIDAQHSGVDWVDTATLATWMAGDERRPLVLLDVRERDEYAVSHLRGARRVAPSATDMAALSIPRNATIIVYCSVGYRSAAMAQRLESAGYDRVFNLLGGIFQWANEGRPVYSGDRRVNLVHPYDREWGQMLDERYRSPL